MKTFVAIVLVALLALNALLFLKQKRLEERIEGLQSSNTQLTQELASGTRLSPEAVRAAEARLAHAEQFMDAVENRLTNATAVLGTLQSAAQRSLSPNGALGPRSLNPGAPRAQGTAGDPEATSLLSGYGGAPLQVASSHTPEGQLQQRSWGPEQVLGPPNTHAAGDIPTAWAPLSSAGQGEEWLHVSYERPVEISQINVRETHNPGAISKITAMMPDGSEVMVWEGTEPKAEAPVDMSFNVPAGVSANSVKVYLDRTRVPGWNEIDAVELIGRDGSRQWATSAKASSSFAGPR
jgi:hypothetical protein